MTCAPKIMLMFFRGRCPIRVVHTADAFESHMTCAPPKNPMFIRGRCPIRVLQMSYCGQWHDIHDMCPPKKKQFPCLLGDDAPSGFYNVTWAQNAAVHMKTNCNKQQMLTIESKELHQSLQIINNQPNQTLWRTWNEFLYNAKQTVLVNRLRSDRRGQWLKCPGKFTDRCILREKVAWVWHWYLDA